MFCEPKEKRREKKELIGFPVIFRAHKVEEPRIAGMTKGREDRRVAWP
jgi:hypothetical protein